MIRAKGQFNEAIIYADEVEASALEQIKALLNQEFVKGSSIRVMPDVHSGMGCTIGTTMTILDKVVPNLVGVDIGCGLIVARLEDKLIDFDRLDKTIRSRVPSGFSIRRDTHRFAEQISLDKLKLRDKVKLDRAYKSIGTLGGGNHFVEVNQDSFDNLYLVIHSGSRHLGNEVARIYQETAISSIKDKNIPKSLAYLEGKGMDDYLQDMALVQEYANLNRRAMLDVIVESLSLSPREVFSTIHNYIDLDRKILRKGAVSALKDEKLIIPINMRDGSIIAMGKGNKEWNYSAPHGAGRLMSRTEAKKRLRVDEFKSIMSGVYSTTVSKSTLDECPMAYKSKEAILSQIDDTVSVLDVIKPLYNYKATD